MTQQECHIENIITYLGQLEEDLKKIQLNANNEQPSEKSSEEQRPPSLCSRVIGRIKKIGQRKTSEGSNHASDSGKGGNQNTDEDVDLVIRKLQNDIRQMKAAFENLNRFQEDMRKNLDKNPSLSNLKAILKKMDSNKPSSHDLKKIRREVFNLKSEIPSLLYKQSSRGLSFTGDSQTAGENDKIDETGHDIHVPSLHVSEKFKDSPAFEEMLEKFEELAFTQQLCLLSFAVFPENREIKRTMLMYWWIGEGFISCKGSEKSAKEILDDFSTKGLLERVQNETKLEPNSYKMEPHVHSAVVHLAETMEIFKLYTSSKESSEGSSKGSSRGNSEGSSKGSSRGNSEGTLTMKRSSKNKVCLVKGSSLEPEAKTSKMKPKGLETVFNSSERYPDFTFKWFPLMESLRVLYLGRWEQTAKRHIEVESTKSLKDIKHLKNLTLASFQGISRIEQLDKYICKLRKLVILDLKACYNLERLPDDIGSLESLIYLDVSECYMLDRMPKGIAYLSNLQVLKGFVISQSDDESKCAVKNLVRLRKLSITVNSRSFKVEKLMESLSDLKQLESLKVSWGALFPKDLKEQEDDQMQNKGQASKENKGDGEEKGASSKREDGRNEEANLEEGKKHDEVNAESPSQEATETTQKGKEKVEEGGDGDTGKADLEERKKQDEVEAEKSKSDKVVEGEKKASPAGESPDLIQKKPDDKSKVEKEGDGDKATADLDEGKKRDEVEAEISKSDKVFKGDEKTSPPQESKEKDQSKPDDKSKVEKEGDGDTGKAGPEEWETHDEVRTTSLKSDNVDKGDEKISPPQESKEKIQSKPDDKSKVEKEGDGDKGKAGSEEGKKHDEVGTEGSKSDNVVEGDEKISPPQESKETIQNKTTNQTKVEKEGDGSKEKANPEEGRKTDEVKEESTKSDNGAEGVKKTNPSQESTDPIQNKPDDHQRSEKQEEKGDGDKEKTNPDEVKAESSKPDKVIEGDEKTSPPKDSIDTIQSKPNDHREIRKVQEKVDGEKNMDDLKKLDGVEEAKTQKSDKTNKIRKRVSFSENTEALIQKKPDDLKRDNAMGGESHETSSPSNPPMESGSTKAKLKRKFTKNLFGGRQEDQAMDTSKLFSSLKKLELECFPEKDPPTWLNPQNLNKLEKLSIKGGKLSRISGEPLTEEKKWPVKILRLKYLHEFKVEWKDLQAQFPKVILLEKYECPKIAFCPTDGNGVWRSQPRESPNM